MILRVALSLLVAAAVWWSYQAGQNSKELECNAMVDSLREQSEKSRLESEAKNNDLETIRITEKQSADARNKVLAKRLADAQRNKPAVSDSGNFDAFNIPADVRGVLYEAASDPRLAEARDTSGATGSTDTAR